MLWWNFKILYLKKFKFLQLIHKERKKKTLRAMMGCVFESCLIDDKFIKLIILFLCLFIIRIDQEHCMWIAHWYLRYFHFAHFSHLFWLWRWLLQVTKTQFTERRACSPDNQRIIGWYDAWSKTTSNIGNIPSYAIYWSKLILKF